MDPPVMPNKDDCCNNGCKPCIFDAYEKQLKLYEKFKWDENSCDVSENGITDLNYTTFFLVDAVKLNNKHKILLFKKVKPGQNKVGWNPGDHFLIKYTSINNISCTRAYTPIKLKLSSYGKQDYDFLIIVKKYDNGLVSNYLFDLTLGSETLWRGPYGSYYVEQNKYNRIVMIAQGTGIAPFLSIIQNILDNEEDMTRIVLYFCCKKINEILFRDDLYDFHSYWNFCYKIFISSTQSDDVNSNIKYEEPLVFKKLNEKDIENLNSHFNDQYLLCGSSHFMQDYEKIIRTGNGSNIILF